MNKASKREFLLVIFDEQVSTLLLFRVLQRECEGYDVRPHRFLPHDMTKGEKDIDLHISSV